MAAVEVGCDGGGRIGRIMGLNVIFFASSLLIDISIYVFEYSEQVVFFFSICQVLPLNCLES